MVLMGGLDVFVTECKRLMAAFRDVCLFGKVACDFLASDKHLTSGVTIILFLR